MFRILYPHFKHGEIVVSYVFLNYQQLLIGKTSSILNDRVTCRPYPPLLSTSL